MRWLKGLAAGLMLVSGLAQAASAEEMLPEADAGAIDVVEQYLGYLFAGDVKSLRPLLGSSMTKPRDALLKNKRYETDLLEEYAGASSEIVSSQQLNPEEAQVDARILYPSGDTMAVRFILHLTSKGYRIVSEF